MTPFNMDELRLAYQRWYSSYRHREADTDIAPFLSDGIRAFSPERTSWLRRARQAQFLSTDRVAREMKMTRSTYFRLEEREKNGSITIANLAKAAEAMDCELVYAVRPRNRKLFSKLIWDRIWPAAIDVALKRSINPHTRGFALGYIAEMLMLSPAFRRLQEWSTQKWT